MMFQDTDARSFILFFFKFHHAFKTIFLSAGPFNAFEKIHSPESSKRMENSVSFELNGRLSLLCLVRSGPLSALYVQPSVNSTHTLPPLVMKTNSTAVFGYSLNVYFWLQPRICCSDSRKYKNHSGEEILDSLPLLSLHHRGGRPQQWLRKLKHGGRVHKDLNFPFI